MQRRIMNARIEWLTVFGSALFFIGLCAAQAGKPTPPPVPKTIPELQQAIQKILAQDGVPGAGVALVAKDHVIWAGGVGKADLSVDRDVTAGTMFRVGSISKSFVALALLKLAEEKKIDLNAPLREVAPEIPFRNPWAATDPVRIADVLEHTAGFDDMHPAGAYNLEDSPEIPLLTVLQKASSSLISRWPPAERMAYSNEDYGIAGYLIEKITGEPYDKYVHDTILAPLGMTESGFRLSDAIRGELAQGYEGKPPKPVPYEHIYLTPAGDLKSSPAEMVHLVQMLLNRGMVGGTQLLSPQSIQRMETPETTLASRNGMKTGYGLANYWESVAGFPSHGHDGGIDGFISTYRYFPELGLGDVVFLNSSSSGEALQQIELLVTRYMTQGTEKPKPPAVFSVSPAQLASYTGYYQPTNPRVQLMAFLDRLLGGAWIIAENGKLYQKGLFGGRQELIPVTADQFRLQNEPEADRIFMRDGNGNEIYATEGVYAQRVGMAWPITRLVLVGLAFLVMASSGAFALIWIPRKLLGRMHGVQHLAARWVPLLALAALLGAVADLNMTPGWLSGIRDSHTIVFCALTWAFAALSAVALILSLLAIRDEESNLAARIHSLLVAVACCSVAGWLGWLGLIGTRFWRA